MRKGEVGVVRGRGRCGGGESGCGRGGCGDGERWVWWRRRERWVWLRRS